MSVNDAPVIVVGYKDSADSRHALDTAIDLGIRLDAHIRVVHVRALDDYPVDPDSEDWEGQGQAHLVLIRRQVAALLTPGMPGSTYSEERGDPAHVLQDVATASGALMIVVGLPSSGTGPLSRLFTRPVSVAITKHPECPVLMVPRTKDESA
ncbi:MAG: universal stress protein [Nocardioides sp.]